MIVQVKGTVVAVLDTKTKKDGKPYRVVSLLQEGEKTAEIVRVNLWNGTNVEKGKLIALTAGVRAFQGTRGGAMLSVDVY